VLKENKNYPPSEEATFFGVVQILKSKESMKEN